MFTEPINKSDQTGLKQQEYLPKDKLNLQSLVPDSKTRTLSADSKKANLSLDFNLLCASKASLFRSSSGEFSTS